MKTRVALFLFTSLIFLATIDVRAQGHSCVTLSNPGATDAKRIFVSDETTGTFVRAAGSAYRIALYWAPAGTTDESLFVRTGDPAGFATGSFAGIFIGGGRTVNTPVSGTVLAFQCRAWAVAYGDSYEAAFANGIGFGKGPIFEMDTADPANPLELYPLVGAAPGFHGFAVIIPEPTIVSLACFCLAALFAFRRNR